jgi:hypothetical protein
VFVPEDGVAVAIFGSVVPHVADVGVPSQELGSTTAQA